MKDASQALQTALSHYKSGELLVAEELYRQVLADDPKNLLSLHMLGIIAIESCRYDEAVKWLEQAIQIRKNDPTLFFTLGFALQSAGRLDEALLKYKKALSLKPDYIEAHTRIADILKSQGKSDEAEWKYKHVVGLKHDQAIASYTLGQVLSEQGKPDEAMQAYQKAIVLKPDYADAYNNLGLVFFGQRKFDQAAEVYKRAIPIKPDYDAFHCNLGNALQELGQLDNAAACYRRTLEINPVSVVAHNNLGSALQELGQLEAAVAEFRLALKIDPNCVDVHNNLARALQELGQLDDAIASYRQALKIKPNDKKFESNLGFALLMCGIFSEGWQKQEARWEAGASTDVRPATHLPQWDGQNPSPGDRLLIFVEQGLGDKLQFSRYIPLAAERFTGGVSVLVSPSVQSLFRRSFPHVEILEAVPADQSAWQWHCPLLSLPLAFGTVLENIPAQIPYLVPDPARIAYWKSKIAALDLSAGTRKIGVVWKPGTFMKIAKLKALAFQQLAPLLEQPDTAWFSLQKEPDPDNVPGKLINWTDELKDFDDTAALAMNLDLIISVDTSVAHLAGGLGLPIWLFNRHASDWRWMRGREDSPWYPSMRIFTQETAGDWDGVVKRVVECLGD